MAAAAPRCNLLLIQVDQMPGWAMSLLGCRNVCTPALDALAGGGTLFRQAICNNPICLPSRISLLSGQYASTTGQFGFSGLCDRRMPWLPRHLQAAGFRTGAFGKLHVLSVGMEQWGMDVACPTMPEDQDLARPADATYRAYCAAHGIPWPTDQMHGHNPFGPAPAPPQAADKAWHWTHQRSIQSDVPLAHSLETWTTNRCLDFLDTCARDQQPFFAWLSYDRPHSPHTLPPEWYSQLAPNKLALPELPPLGAMLKLPPSYFKTFGNYAGAGATGEAVHRLVLAAYFKCIDWLDAEIARVREHLAKLGLDQTTSIVFTADHGDEAGFHGLTDKLRGVDSEALTRVPLLIYPAPCLQVEPRGQQVTAGVSLVDLAPTLCALAGVSPNPAFEGRDLSATVCHGAPLEADAPQVCEDAWTRMIAVPGWRLVFDSLREQECQFYDTTHDPDCFWNRYDDPALVWPRCQLKRQLLGFLCARLHGPWTAADVTRLERGLDPGDSLLPALVTGGAAPIQCYRAGAYLRGEGHTLFVPFYSERLRLFRDPPKMYPTLADVVPLDLPLVERLLDAGLRELFPQVASVSHFIHRTVYQWQHPENRPAIADIIALRAKARDQAG
jgi:arylsulfatase A-like enzyme